MCRVVFGNWDSSPNGFHQCEPFDLPDLSSYNLFFFDPMRFAISHGFKRPDENPWKTDYVSCAEVDFVRYVGRAKTLTSQIRNFINSGGIWIIRANVPEAYIKVRKKSQAGTGAYTESIISVFFWMEEFFGKYAFVRKADNSYRFINRRTPIFRVFGDRPAECFQTQNLIPKGNVEVIAESGGLHPLPVISRISYAPGKGEVYFIPRFQVEDEYQKLVDAFGSIICDKTSEPTRPGWMEAYDRQLASVNPFSRALQQIDEDMARLERARGELETKREEMQRLGSLLHKSDRELTAAVENAFKLLGFIFSEPPASAVKGDLHFRNSDGRQVIIKIVSTKNGPVTIDDLPPLETLGKGNGAGPNTKIVIVANSACSTSPEQRTVWLDDDVIALARSRDICLLTTHQLFDIACYLMARSESPIIDNIKASLRQDLIVCDDVFSMQEQKYLATV